MPLTRDSLRDNFRPIVPAWDVNNTALLWFRGTYNTAQSYDAAIVGLVERRSEIAGLETFVDATTNNTALVTGGSLVPGAGANQWHERMGEFNGGAVLASADVSAENAPALKTAIPLPESGTYDVWVNFWGNPTGDWRVKAGLATNQMRILRQLAGQQVEPGQHNASLVLTNNGTNFLYQAYLGRVSGSAFEVFVDDEPIQTGTTATTVGNTARTWYEGISFAKVEGLRITSVSHNAAGASATLTWSSIPAARSLTTPTYTVQKKISLLDPGWTTLATNIPSGGTTTSYLDTAAAGNTSFYRVSSP
jgi:hypothetical protein